MENACFKLEIISNDYVVAEKAKDAGLNITEPHSLEFRDYCQARDAASFMNNDHRRDSESHLVPLLCSKAEKVYLNENLSHLFFMISSVTESVT